MERRVFVTLIACTLFTLVYLSVVKKDEPPTGVNPAAATTTPDGGGAAPGGDGGGDRAEPLPTGAGQSADVGPIAVEPFESEHLRVEFTNRGAAVTQVWLKKFFVTAEAAELGTAGLDEWVSVFPTADNSYGNALVLRELVTTSRPARYNLEAAHWAVERDETSADGERVLVFAYDAADGYRFRKRISCHPGEHFLRIGISMEAGVETVGDQSKSFELLLRAAGGVQDVERGQWTLEPEAVAMLLSQHDEPSVERHSASALEGSPESVVGQGKTTVAFCGNANLYFAALLAPDVKGSAKAADLRAISEDQPEKIQSELVLQLQIPRGGGKAEATFRYFVGPKDPALLEAQGLDVFQPLIEEDYGTWTSFRWINKLLLLVMKFFHGFVGNWGIAIILLTLLVRICVFPITRTQQVSMQKYSQKMQVLKPKLDALKEKFKDKPQKFAQEQMKLLKEHNARPPLLGCLTMLVTFPVFIGMFQILRTSIELRQAPFVAWIGDLSLPDAMFEVPGIGMSFNLLPILATAAFVGQMALAPKPADPQARQQQKIMFIMPVIFGVMFYNYAAGLSLYMLTSSLYGMFEYKFIRQKFFPNPT